MFIIRVSDIKTFKILNVQTYLKHNLGYLEYDLLLDILSYLSITYTMNIKWIDFQSSNNVGTSVDVTLYTTCLLTVQKLTHIHTFSGLTMSMVTNFWFLLILSIRQCRVTLQLLNIGHFNCTKDSCLVLIWDKTYWVCTTILEYILSYSILSLISKSPGI